MAVSSIYAWPYVWLVALVVVCFFGFQAWHQRTVIRTRTRMHIATRLVRTYLNVATGDVNDGV